MTVANCVAHNMRHISIYYKPKKAFLIARPRNRTTPLQASTNFVNKLPINNNTYARIKN